MSITYTLQIRLGVMRAGAALRAARRTYRNAERARLRKIRRLPVPERLTEPAQRLTAALMEADTLRDGSGTVRARRAMDVLEVRLRARELRKALTAAASTPEEQSYCEVLNGLAADTDRDRNASEREIARAFSELIAHLESMRAPKRKRWRHEELCRAWREEFVAMSTFHAQAAGLDPAAARDALAGYADAVEVRSGRLRALGFYELKPSR
ncbi:MAG TPA: hypothetical protein VGF91_05990 [Solirubrobacteraceae bacterium]|jgi:hypothetical protein